jgi:hypothetical protein
MPKFNLNLRDPGSLRPTPVYLIIRYKKYRIVYSTGEKILPAKWDKKKQRQKFILSQPEIKFSDLLPEQKKEYQQIKNFNLRLSEILHIAEYIFDNFLEQNEGEEPDPKEYKLLLDIELEKTRYSRTNLFTFLKNFIEDKRKIAQEKGKENYRGANYKGYIQLLNHLKDYVKQTQTELDFKNIDVDFYYYFADFLRHQKELQPNTIGKHIKMLRSILNSATENGINNNLHYKSKYFKVITVKADIIVLDESELELLLKLDLYGNKTMDRVRDIFLISALTGLKHTDFHRIVTIHEEQKIAEIAIPGENFTLSIPFHPDLPRLIRKYNEKNVPGYTSESSNGILNQFIKKVCAHVPEFHERMGVDRVSRQQGEKKISEDACKYELITMQTARRSYFFNAYHRDLDIFLLTTLSGHSSQENFLRYIGITRQEHVLNLQKRYSLNSSR